MPLYLARLVCSLYHYLPSKITKVLAHYFIGQRVLLRILLDCLLEHLRVESHYRHLGLQLVLQGQSPVSLLDCLNLLRFLSNILIHDFK